MQITTPVITCLSIDSKCDPTEVTSFIKILRNAVGEGQLLIGLSYTDDTAPERLEDPSIVWFPPRTPRSQMYNQLIARSVNEDVLILDGMVVPEGIPTLNKTNKYAMSLDGTKDHPYSPETDMRWVELDGLRTHVHPDSPAEPIDVQDLFNYDYSRDFHMLSPIAIHVSHRDYMHVRGMDENPTYAHCMFMDLIVRMRRCGGKPQKPGGDIPIRAWDVSSIWKTVNRNQIQESVTYRDNQLAQIQKNRSIYRNLNKWSVPTRLRPVLVTVAIATRNRGAYIKDSILSILAQDFQDFEIIVVDDGSTDDTRSRVSEIKDSRVRYQYIDPSGISAARNVAASLSAGYFTAVHDDDDIMLPWRLSAGLQALDSEHRASYGSWVNFDNDTGEMVLHITKSEFGRELVAFNGQTPGHATWLLPTRFITSLGYNESYSSSVDHNLATRTLMAGLTWRHSEKVLFLRRIHPTQVSVTDSRRQRGAASLTRLANTYTSSFAGRKQLSASGKNLGFPDPIKRDKLIENFAAYLPDHLVQRCGIITNLVGKKVLALDAHSELGIILTDVDILSDKGSVEIGALSEITWEKMVRIRQLELVGVKYRAVLRASATPEKHAENPTSSVLLEDRLQVIMNQSLKISRSASMLVVETEYFDIENIESSDPRPVIARKISVSAEPEFRMACHVLGFAHPSAALSFCEQQSIPNDKWQLISSAGYVYPAQSNSKELGEIV